MLMAAMLYKWLLVSGFPLLFSLNGSFLKNNAVETAGFHPFYIAVTEVNQNATDKTFEISCKMFADDLEAILEKNYKTTLDITTEKDKPNFDKFIPDYIGKHLVITVDGKAAKLTYVGFENDKESAYAYFEITGIASAKKLEISNTILHDFINEQINIMHVTVNGNRQSTKLAYPNSQASFSF